MKNLVIALLLILVTGFISYFAILRSLELISQPGVLASLGGVVMFLLTIGYIVLGYTQAKRFIKLYNNNK